MCDDYYDEMCAVWNETHPRARTPHRCHTCKETIAPGVRYRRTATLHDGAWQRWKHCMRCAAILDALRVKLDAFGTDTLDMACGEVWESPPEHVAALAFALPGDPEVAQA